jgi:hypothetical protein
VNGGLARSARRRVIPSVGASGETTNRESDSPQSRERIGRRPRVARDRHPAALTSPKAGRGSRDRGCNGHRILRRVPTDGRYSGSSRCADFHEAAIGVVLAVSASSDPSEPFQKKDGGDEQHPRKRVRREGERGSRQGCQRFDRTGIVGRKRPRSSRKAARLEG